MGHRRNGIAFGILTVSCAWAGHTITAVEETHSAIGETMYRIHLFAKATGRIPSNLESLPKRNGYANSIDDGWAVPLTYRVMEDGTLTLTSLGKDRKVGGTGENADIASRYRWRDERGRFIAADEYWIVDGEVSR